MLQVWYLKKKSPNSFSLLLRNRTVAKSYSWLNFDYLRITYACIFCRIGLEVSTYSRRLSVLTAKQKAKEISRWDTCEKTFVARMCENYCSLAGAIGGKELRKPACIRKYPYCPIHTNSGIFNILLSQSKCDYNYYRKKHGLWRLNFPDIFARDIFELYIPFWLISPL